MVSGISMCNGVCPTFEKQFEPYHYCQACRKFIGESNLYRENKEVGRLRCSCCHGLVRNKVRFYSKLVKTLPTVD